MGMDHQRFHCDYSIGKPSGLSRTFAFCIGSVLSVSDCWLGVCLEEGQNTTLEAEGTVTLDNIGLIHLTSLFCSNIFTSQQPFSGTLPIAERKLRKIPANAIAFEGPRKSTLPVLPHYRLDPVRKPTSRILHRVVQCSST